MASGSPVLGPSQSPTGSLANGTVSYKCLAKWAGLQGEHLCKEHCGILAPCPCCCCCCWDPAEVGSRAGIGSSLDTIGLNETGEAAKSHLKLPAPARVCWLGGA